MYEELGEFSLKVGENQGSAFSIEPLPELLRKGWNNEIYTGWDAMMVFMPMMIFTDSIVLEGERLEEVNQKF